MKTVRFAKVVEKSGRPEPYTLWMEPEKDAPFQRALKEHRVLTVLQETVGTKADYGEVGYTGGRGELLIFPKSLKSFVGSRVVGVKYDLLREPAPPTKPATQKPAKPLSFKAKEAKAQPVRASPAPSSGKPEASPRKIVPFTALEPEEVDHEEPDGGSEKAATAKPRSASERKPKREPSPFRLKLRRAMKALEAGKAVQAFQLLQELDHEMEEG